MPLPHDDAPVGTTALRPAPETGLTLRFSSTPRGARLARRIASQQMDTWGWPYGTTVNDTVELITAELAANAVTHGRVPGRDAELRLQGTTPRGTSAWRSPTSEGSDCRYRNRARTADSSRTAGAA
ncbi:hypothetical protein [Streptomyces sp. NPDC002491]